MKIQGYCLLHEKRTSSFLKDHDQAFRVRFDPSCEETILVLFRNAQYHLPLPCWERLVNNPSRMGVEQKRLTVSLHRRAEHLLYWEITIATKEAERVQESEQSRNFGEGAVGELHLHPMLQLVLQNELSWCT